MAQRVVRRMARQGVHYEPPRFVRMRLGDQPLDDRTGLVYEAKLTNPDTAEYHGFPLLDRDPLRQEIIKQWRARAR